MAKHVLYAYLESPRVAELAEDLVERFAEFVASREWSSGEAWAVNQIRSAEPGEWELGLNLGLAERGAEKPDWFHDVEAIAKFLAALNKEIGEAFVIGIGDTETGIADDLFDVSSPEPDIQRLKAVIGVGGVE